MAALPSLRQLRYLLALTEHLNFTRAAEASFVSQSTLSAGLKELESTLGVQLVERDRQSVALTAVGQSVATRARQVLAAAQDLTDFAAAASRPMQGQLRLGVIPTIAPFVLPDVMPILRKKFPGLQLSLREDLTAHLLTRLYNRQLDFILIALPIETGELHVRPLYADKFWLVGRKDDLAVSGRAIRLNHEWTERLLLLEEGHCLRDHALQACQWHAAPCLSRVKTTLLLLMNLRSSGSFVACFTHLIPSKLLNFC